MQAYDRCKASIDYVYICELYFVLNILQNSNSNKVVKFKNPSVPTNL